jgi:Protein of unknown function (DUF1569)
MDPVLENLTRSLQSAVEGLSEEQFSWHPAANKWSVAEILEHLYLSYTGTAKGFEKMLAAGKPVFAPATGKSRIRKLVVLGFNYLPFGRESPPSTRPKGLPPEKVRLNFPAKIAIMDAFIAKAEGQFGHGAPILDHPFLGPLSGPQWRKFHRLHGQHHRKQIMQLRASMPAKQFSAVP